MSEVAFKMLRVNGGDWPLPQATKASESASNFLECCSSSENYYDCELVEQVEKNCDIYSKVVKTEKGIDASRENHYSFDQRIIESFSKLPVWLRTSSLHRTNFSVALPRPTGPPDPPPTRMTSKSWRAKFGSFGSNVSLESLSTQTASSSSQSSSSRKPTNSNHCRPASFTTTFLKATTKVFKPYNYSRLVATGTSGESKKRSDNKIVGSTTSVNSFIDENGHLITPPARRTKSVLSQNVTNIPYVVGSTTSINSFVDEDGKLITPPIRTKNRLVRSSSNHVVTSIERGNVPNVENTKVKMDHVYNGSTVSLNKILTSNGFITPPCRKKNFKSSICLHKNLCHSSLQNVKGFLKPMVRGCIFKIFFLFF